MHSRRLTHAQGLSVVVERVRAEEAVELVRVEGLVVRVVRVARAVRVVAGVLVVAPRPE